jgi:mono/diheme cytochrome c family protein
MLMSRGTRKLLARVGLALLALFLLIQLVPYGRAHDNPPVTREARWPPGQGEQLAEQSCYDCHSNLTEWRWYSNVAPASWLVQHDVDEGRETLNFSEWNRGQPPLDELVEQVGSGEMPPWKYTLVHPSTSLSDAEKAQLTKALTQLYGADPPPIGGG